MINKNLKLDGKELYLRYPRSSDFDEIVTLYQVNRGHFRGLVQPSYDRQSYDQFVKDISGEALESFFIIRSRDDRIAGTITLSQIFRKRFQNAYLGYLLGKEFTGKGLMTESVRLILRFAFLDLRLHRIEANVQPGNQPSIAVLQRNGFSKEGFSRRYLKIGGRWRDHERWAILKEDWSSNK